MNGKALWGGLKSALAAILTVLLFPLLWARSLRLARRHADVDKRGTAKVALAIVLSVLILAGGAYKLHAFGEHAKDEMYVSLEHTSLNNRLKTAVGETEYQDNVATITASDVAIPIIQRNLANATASGDQAKATELRQALNDTQLSRAKAAAKVESLGPNHDLFERLQPVVQAHDDAGIRNDVAGSGLAYPPTMAHDVDAALAVKDKSVNDMTLMLWLFAWPSLFGAFFAPLAFAVGSILSRAFVPSDTVGYKSYPSGAAGLFLLFGAFGVPSLPFAAWVFHDFEKRSVEGQIAL